MANNCHVLPRAMAQLLFLLFLPLLVTSSVDSDYYTAAVLEHVRFGNLDEHSPGEIIEQNLRTYSLAAEAAATQGADIIVFAEAGLFPSEKTNRSRVRPFLEDVPDPRYGKRNPCNEKDVFEGRPILRTLSCLAQRHKIFIVANMGDIKDCDDLALQSCDADNLDECEKGASQCPADGVFQFNTNVAFDRDGNLIARYYKKHLYFEHHFNTPWIPQHSVFETDFGTFTTFICFDIIFKEAVEAVERLGIVNVAYPTYWFEHFPLSSSIQTQQAFAIANRVNLLAANVHLPGTGTLGSGIYSGRNGALVYNYNPDGQTKLLVSKVPKRTDVEDLPDNIGITLYFKDDKEFEVHEPLDESVQEQCSVRVLGFPTDLVKDYRCVERNTTNFASKRLEKPSDELEVCKGDWCCSLSYSADSMEEDYYLMAFAGTENFYEAYGFCVETCVMVRCNPGSDGRCVSYPTRTNTVFKHLRLSGKFTTSHVYPSVMLSGLRLAPVSEWTYDAKGSIVFDSQSEDLLLVVGLHGRCYDNDREYSS